MNLEELKKLIDRQDSGSEVGVELYTRSGIRSGQLTCPVGSRLSDLLNDSYPGVPEGGKTFLGFVPACRPGDVEQGEDKPKEYVSKSTIQLLAVFDNDLGRGIGASGSGSHHLYQEKLPIRVSLQLGTYTLIGIMHYGMAQTVEDVLNEKYPFLPLTEVTMLRDNRYYGTRPFVAVNKREVILCKEEG